jgi:hypothetical protein
MEPRFGHTFSALHVGAAVPQPVRTGMTVGAMDDRYEQEAERMADSVISTVAPNLSEPAAHRTSFDFSQIRVHADAKAAESAWAVNALAYTVGHDVVFGAGQYQPGTRNGRRLIAHELVHVLQQSSAGPMGVIESGATQGRKVQRMMYGSSNAPEMDGVTVQVVPTSERRLVDQAIGRIRAVAHDSTGFAKCHDFFARECNGGPDTLHNIFDAAILWKWPPEADRGSGAIADTPGHNIAYTAYSYKQGAEWLSGALVHELLHNCGAGGGELPPEQGGGASPHRRADIARLYCMGPGKNEVTAKATVDLDRNLNLLLSYRRLVGEWASGRLQLDLGTDISLSGLLRQAGDRAVPAELGSGVLGLRGRAGGWGAERYGGFVLAADLGLGADRFKLRNPNPGDGASTRIAPGLVLQVGTRIEFWFPDLSQREGRTSALSFEAAYRLVQPLTPDAQQIHEFVLGLGGSF